MNSLLAILIATYILTTSHDVYAQSDTSLTLAPAVEAWLTTEVIDGTLVSAMVITTLYGLGAETSILGPVSTPASTTKPATTTSPTSHTVTSVSSSQTDTSVLPLFVIATDISTASSEDGFVVSITSTQPPVTIHPSSSQSISSSTKTTTSSRATTPFSSSSASSTISSSSTSSPATPLSSKSSSSSRTTSIALGTALGIVSILLALGGTLWFARRRRRRAPLERPVHTHAHELNADIPQEIGFGLPHELGPGKRGAQGQPQDQNSREHLNASYNVEKAPEYHELDDTSGPWKGMISRLHG